MHRYLLILPALLLTCLPAVAQTDNASSPRVRHIRKVQPAPPQPEVAPELTVRIHDENAAPIPNAAVTWEEYWLFNQPDRRKADHPGRTEHRFTGADGTATLPCSPIIANKKLHIQADGYALYRKDFTVSDGVPASLHIQLTPGKTVRGQCVGPHGEALEGAKIRLRWELTKDAPQGTPREAVTPVLTDENGQWAYTSLPVEARSVDAHASHPDFHIQQSIPKPHACDADGEFAPITHTLTGRNRYRLTGRVVDEAGNPISGVCITSRGRYGPEDKGATDANGRFSVWQYRPEASEIAVIHPDFAPQQFSYRISADNSVHDWQALPRNPMILGGPQTDITLKPGKPAKIRLTDKRGKPLPNAAVTWTLWDSFGLSDFSEVLSKRTDENGELLWKCVPLSTAAEVRLRIIPENETGPQYMCFIARGLYAGEELYEITVPRPLTISGTVTDAATGEPVTEFTTVMELGPDLTLPWNEHNNQWRPWPDGEGESNQIHFPDGRFTLTLNHCVNPNKPTRVLFTADGYDAFLSHQIPWDAEDVTLNVKLTPTRPISGLILQPDGTTPAAKADVMLGNAQTQVCLSDGRMEVNRKWLAHPENDDLRKFDANDVRFFCETGEDGRFHFPKSPGAEYIQVAHATGWACVRLAEYKEDTPIALQPWGEVKGRVVVEGTPAADVQVGIYMNPLLPPDEKPSPADEKNRCFFFAITDDAGNFAFRHVMPGRGMLGYPERRFLTESSFIEAFSHPQEVRVTAGETVQADMGTTGQNLFGRLQWTADAPNPAPWHRWQVRLYRTADDCIYYADFARDDTGIFRLPDIPAGEYEFMYAHFTGGQENFHIHSIITVPLRPETGYGPPRDLGVFPGNEE